tara:strand:- start:28 stop:231 length:204 start_codon:yes stop_codon:yes gene_type:complete
MITEYKIQEKWFNPHTDEFEECRNPSRSNNYTLRRIDDHVMLKTRDEQIFYMEYDELKKVVETMSFE